MTIHKGIIGISFFILFTFVSCGKPAQNEQPPVNEKIPDLTAKAQTAVEQTVPQAPPEQALQPAVEEQVLQEAPQTPQAPAVQAEQPIAVEPPGQVPEAPKAEGQGQGESLEQLKKRIGFDQVWKSETYDHEFAGVTKCSLCHKKESQGSQYQIWQATAHARAFGTLGTPAAIELANKLGIADPQQSGKCLRCHSTAYAFGEQKVTDKIPVEEGISCETCHGPGMDYGKLTVMKDREEAIAAGLIIPGEQTCLKCHNESAPNVKAFNFQESWGKIIHPVPR